MDKTKIWVSYFFKGFSYMKFQNLSIHKIEHSLVFIQRGITLEKEGIQTRKKCGSNIQAS